MFYGEPQAPFDSHKSVKIHLLSSATAQALQVGAIVARLKGRAELDVF